MRRASIFKVLTSGLLFAIVGTIGAQSPDPSAVREQQRAEILKRHYGMDEALALDKATFDKLIDLVTVGEMDRREHQPVGNDWLISRAERMNHNFARVSSLLGPEKFERYQALRFTVHNRREVSELDHRLGTADRLSATQREQLVTLLFDDLMQEIKQHFEGGDNGTALRALPRKSLSVEEVQRRRALSALAANEAALRRITEADRQMYEKAAKFLTGSQLGVFKLQHSQHAQEVQKAIEQMRTQMGVSSTTAEAGLAPVAGEVKLRIMTIIARGEPKDFTEVVSSGKPVTFQIDEALFMQARVMLFEQDQYDLRISYYEVGPAGKRWLSGTSSSGVVVQPPPDGPSRQLSSGGGTIVTGTKAYAVQLGSVVEAI